jgi:poly(hydroxyalkanoate) depolymerase family esterase
MRKVSDTITRLTALRNRPRPTRAPAAATSLKRLDGFGSNPGSLDAWCFVPDGLAPGAPLVVVLHGCTQDAAGYDHGSGWSQLAQEQGFAVLLPEQRRSNNMNLCFNWYEPADSRRGAGEPLSIRQMIDAMIDRHAIDPGRVFVTGLSAGGAMASVMLATYPDVFAGGAIIAGLPFGAASTVPEAFDRMRGHGGPDEVALAAAVRAASPHQGPWPTIAVWHGSADHTVVASNGLAIVEQWRRVHGLDAAPSEIGRVEGYPHRVWRDDRGRVVLEDYLITGMGHGTPLSTAGADGCGTSGAYMLEVAISSTRHIAQGWGIASRSTSARPQVQERVMAAPPKPVRPPAATGAGKVIEDALRAAGLMA